MIFNGLSMSFHTSINLYDHRNKKKQSKFSCLKYSMKVFMVLIVDNVKSFLEYLDNIPI